MIKLPTLIKKNEIKNVPNVNSDNIVSSIRNWYSDRYSSIIIQRNFLLIILIFALLILLVSTIVVGNVVSTFKIQPFVIEVEDKTGLTNVVNPLADNQIVSNVVLKKYFIMKYIKARESYNMMTYKNNYFFIVRLLSAPQVYREFSRFIRSPNSPISLYGTNYSTSVTFRSIQFFPSDFNNKLNTDEQAVVRFTISSDTDTLPNTGGTNKIHKIVTLNYRYQQMEMTEVERSENPLGFTISFYLSDIENNVIDTIGN